MKRRGFTLIEMLMAVALLALVLSVVLSRAGSSSQAARLNAIAVQWQDLDRRARLLAPQAGPLNIVISDSTMSVTRCIDDQLLLWAEAATDANVRGPQQLIIDRHGRSKDYQISLRSGDVVVAWTVYGTVGAIEVHDDAR